MPLHSWCPTTTSYMERKAVFLPRTLLQINVPGITYTLVARCIICSCRGRQVCNFSIINENRLLPLKDSRKRPYGFNSHSSSFTQSTRPEVPPRCVCGHLAGPDCKQESPSSPERLSENQRCHSAVSISDCSMLPTDSINLPMRLAYMQYRLL